MDIKSFINRYPRIFHMAEADSWNSIQAHGLLSISAILDKHGIQGQNRTIYETAHRPQMMTISSALANDIVIRDQKPMPPSKLALGLRNGITPNQWYFFLNQKVFFWATRERLMTLLNARPYRNLEHDVLTIDTRQFIQDYIDSINICHMNSGNAYPVAHNRDYSIFTTISNYPVKQNGAPIKEVAEVTVAHSVPNITNYVQLVERRRADDILDVLYQR